MLKLESTAEDWKGMSKEGDRYARLELLLDITKAFAQVNKREGLSTQDLEEMFSISRSTACRMKSVIDRVFGLEETYSSKNSRGGNDRKKYWYLSAQDLNIIPLSPNEYAQLEECKKILENDGRSSVSIEKLINKLKVITNKKVSDVDIEELLRTQGYALRQVPKAKFNKGVLEDISDAILQMKCVEFDYPSAKSKTGVKRVKVEPYGIVFGTNVNLLVHNVEDEDKDFKRYYTLNKISNVVVTDEDADIDPDFELKDYLKNSFGVYQEKELLDVKLQFDKSVKDSVLNYSFHPSQKMEVLESGDVIVTFTACGTLEMCWHFFTWGKKCKVLEPQSLKEFYKEKLNEVLETLK